jgi:broad specificity phosphatase PhoE
MPVPATLIFLRHAAIECSSNGKSLLCGSFDAPLSAAGQLQVERVRRRLQTEPPIDRLYSSPLRRSLATAEAAPDSLLHSLCLLKALAEIDCGAVEGMPLDDVQQRYPEYWRRNEAQEDEMFCWPGGETYGEFRTRVRRAITSIAQLHLGRRVLIVTHAGVINQVLGTISGQSAACWKNFRPGYASLTQVAWENGHGSIERFDDCSHL